MGEFHIGQSLGHARWPTLDALAISHHTLTDEATMPFIVDKSIKQAYATQAPVAFTPHRFSQAAIRRPRRS